MNIDVKDTALMKYLGSTDLAYYGKALELRDAVQGWLSYIPETFPHYTRHTVQHSEEIISQISKLMFDDESERPTIKITPVEAYVLIAAAYLHDTGMVAADTEKLEIITSNEEWKRWISDGGAAKRWSEIAEIRNSKSLAEEARNFVADLQTRFLLAEFIRRQHHLRASDVIKQHEANLGRFAFNDQSLMRTIADVCISHGLRDFELEDNERFPESRDIQGYKVNVRLMAILLRLGDLLDMSYDRACPLLLNATSPIPADSLAHWTQYQRITHRSTSPKRIEITAECERQEEHRVLQDWCQWIVDEVENASVLMSRSESHSRWQPPLAKMGDGETIKIRPAAGATYIPSSWTFEMDKEAVLQLLIKDVYQNPLIFIRELIQNALDANRSQMYIDLRRDGLSEPEYPTEVEQNRRDRYPVKVTLESRLIPNDLSGEMEYKQFLIVEDYGIGMDREVIERYFLQIGRSYYTSEAFRRHFSFIPTSRFGIGFLSVFAVSDWVTIDTYKPTLPSPESIRLTIIGPRNYLLTEHGQRRTNGTRIEVKLREPSKKEDALKAIVGWCKRAEFPIIVDILGAQQTIIAERADDFTFERPNMRHENARFLVRAFPLEHPGLEGEIYVYGRKDENGESWASSFFGKDDDYHPSADEKGAPESLICLHGIALADYVLGDLVIKEHIFNSGKSSFRLDIRDKKYQPTLSRGWNYLLAEEHKGAIRQRLKQALSEHLDTTELTKKQDSWKYKNELVNEYGLMSFWQACPGMIPIYRGGKFTTTSLDQIQSIDSITSVHKKFGDRFEIRRSQDESPLPSNLINVQEADIIIGSDLALLDGKIMSALIDLRLPTYVRSIEDEYVSIDWQLMGQDANEDMNNRIYVSEMHRGENMYIGIKVNNIQNERHVAYFISGTKYPMYWVRGLWNVNNPLVKWLIKIQDACQAGSYDLKRQLSKVFGFLNSYSSGHGGVSNLWNLNIYLKGWSGIQQLSDELYPPKIEITEDMFVFLG
jgi:molecular chaperone HtpG